MANYNELKSWLLSSGLFISDTNDKNCGGVYSFYDEKNKSYSFLYPEITGYFISTLRFLNHLKQDENYSRYAKYSSDWLIKIYDNYGAIIQSINSDSKTHLSYSFDSAICAKGLLDYYDMSKNNYYLEYAKKILSDLITEAISANGSVKPFKDIQTNKFLESKDDVWYKQEGCLHIKTAIPFFQMHNITNDEDQLKIATNICNNISKYQNSDGSIRLHKNSKAINLHTLCYALEGLIYGYHFTKNEDYHKCCELAVNWCLNKIFDDDSIPLWYNSRFKSKAAYSVAQLMRIMILLDKKNNNSNYRSHAERLYSFLISFQASSSNPRINGGFYEELYKSIFDWKKRLRLNSWTSMFALQAIYWLQNYDKISFENSVEYLY